MTGGKPHELHLCEEHAREYLAPLIVGEAYPEYANGMPKYVTLKNASVPKKLDKFEL